MYIVHVSGFIDGNFNTISMQSQYSLDTISMQSRVVKTIQTMNQNFMIAYHNSNYCIQYNVFLFTLLF